MVIKAISEPCIHIVVVKCAFCSCTENLMVTQCACIHVHVSYYGMKLHLGRVHVCLCLCLCLCLLMFVQLHLIGSQAITG